MVKTRFKRVNGKYIIKGKKYEQLVGSRAQVWHKTAYKTSGDLTRDKLYQNKAGRIVSKIKHNTAKKEKRLEKAGYKTRKGHFGSFTDKNKGKHTSKSKSKSKGKRKSKGTRKRK